MIPVIQSIGINLPWIKKLKGPSKFAMAAECALNIVTPSPRSSVFWTNNTMVR
jgi:hypothetical protein